MATGVAGQNTARTTSTLKRRSYLPFLLFSHLPAFFCSSIPRFHNPPHSYHLTSAQIEAFLSFSKSSPNHLQIIQTSSWIPHLYIALATCHTAFTLSSHAPSFRRLKPLSLSLVYLSRKGFESQAPDRQSHWTLTPESPSLSVSSRLRTGTTLPPRKSLPQR